MIPTKRLRSPWLFFIVIAVLIFGVAVFAINPTASPLARKDIVIAATIFPLADIVGNVAGSTAEIVQIIPNGASPHSYTFTPQDVADLQDARVLFVIGHGLDNWSAEPAAESAGVPIISVDEGIALHAFGEHDDEHEEAGHEHEEGSVDPHYWLAIPNAKIIATNVAAALSEIDPERAIMYQENAEQYLETLDAAELQLQQQAAQASQKHFIAMHDAWSYFAEHYGFELVGTYEPVEGREPSVADLQRLQELLDRYNITTFYAEPQKQSGAAIRFASEEFGLAIKTLDPEGATQQNGSYIELMRYNMAQLTK